jgi:hypothetical protein
VKNFRCSLFTPPLGYFHIEQERADRAFAGEVRHRARDVHRRIVDDARARLPPTSSGVGQNIAAAAMLLRAMLDPSTTEGWRIQGELKNLLEDAAVRWAESSASRRQGCPPEHCTTTSRLMREASVHTGRTQDRTPAAPDHLGDEHHRHDRRARLDEKVRRGYHPRRGGRYDSEEDRSPSPEPPGPRVFSRAIRWAPFPTRFRAPTTITKYSGETRPELWLADYRLACQLGGTDDDNLIIRNLPLFLSDAARAWLEHLPPAQISNWDDLVKAFAGNFQGTYVRPGNSWDLRSCRQQPGESLQEYIRRFSKQRMELPNITDLDVIGAFLTGTTCRDLVSKLGRKTRHQVRLWSGGGRSHLPEEQTASGTAAGRRPRGIRPTWHEEEGQEEVASEARRRRRRSCRCCRAQEPSEASRRGQSVRQDAQGVVPLSPGSRQAHP